MASEKQYEREVEAVGLHPPGGCGRPMRFPWRAAYSGMVPAVMRVCLGYLEEVVSVLRGTPPEEAMVSVARLGLGL